MSNSTMTIMALVENTPDYAYEYKYIVARYCENKLWFYGAYNELERAHKVAIECDGIVLETL